jgi:predicted TPR repeat methyltransferase
VGRVAARAEEELLGGLLDELPTCQTALDVGCGTGWFTRWLSSRGLAVTGVDRSSAMLAEARARGAEALLVADACDPW